MVDAVNSVADLFDSVVLAGNEGALFPEDLRRLHQPVSLRTLPLLTRARVLHALGWPSRKLRICIRILFLPIDPFLLLYHFLAGCFFLARLRPDMVLCCNGGYPAATTVLTMTLAARLRRVPVVLSIVSMPMPRKWTPVPLEEWWDRWVFRSASTVVVNAAAIARALHVLRGMSLEKCHVVHNGLDDEPAVAANGAGNHPLTVGAVARWDRLKGGEYLVDAIALLSNPFPDIRLVLAGKGDANEELSARVRRHGLEGRVEMAGHYSGDVGKLLSGFDIYAFPSLHEGFPYSILEAMRAGRAIVATAVGGIPEAIEDGKEGLLVSPGSAEELAAAMERLIRDEPLRQRLGAGARSRFLSRFHIRTMRDNLRKIFRIFLSSFA